MTPEDLDKIKNDTKKLKLLEINFKDIDEINAIYQSVDQNEFTKYSLLDKTINDDTQIANEYGINNIKIDIYKPNLPFGNNLELNKNSNNTSLEYSHILNDINTQEGFTNFVKTTLVPDYTNIHPRLIDKSHHCINNRNIIDLEQTEYYEEEQLDCLVEEEEDLIELSMNDGRFKQIPGTHYHDKTQDYIVCEESFRKQYPINQKTNCLIVFVNKREETIPEKQEYFYENIIDNLKKNISVFKIYIDDSKLFYQKFYLINYILRHFLNYSDNYGIKKDNISLHGEGIIGLICFILTYYKGTEIDRIHLLLGIPQIPFPPIKNVKMLIFDNPILFVNNLNRKNFMMNIQDETGMNIFSGSETDSVLLETFKTNINNLNTNLNQKKLDELSSLLDINNKIDTFTTFKTQKPIVILDINEYDFTNQIQFENTNYPFEAYQLYNKVISNDIHNETFIPYFNVGDLSRIKEKINEFIKNYFAQEEGNYKQYCKKY